MEVRIAPIIALEAMSRKEQELMQRARHRYGEIQPCQGRSFAECFLKQNGMLQFWFNDSTGNTRLLYVEERAMPVAR
jgi:hypothetical protein